MRSFKEPVAGCAAALSIIAFVNCTIPTAMLFSLACEGEDRENSSTGHMSNGLTHVEQIFWDEVR